MNGLARASFVVLAVFSSVASAQSLGVSPTAPMTFGNVRVGSQSSPQNLVISNGAGSPSLSYSITSGSTEFPLSCAGGGGACLSGSIAGGSSVTVMVQFAPSATGARSTNLTIMTNDPDP